MAKFVPDIKTNRWVIIAPARSTRPHNNGNSKEIDGKCVFCPGNEYLNPLELYRVSAPPGAGQMLTPDWKIRVIANKYPITDMHEVIIHSPDHNADVDNLPLEHVEMLIHTYRQRYNFHTENGHGTVLIFNNHDVQAGASIKHAHSQLVVVPKQINLDTVIREPVNNLVAETDYFYVYCPDFSQWPYEVWIAPREAGHAFGEINDIQVKNLASLLQKTLIIINKKFLPPDGSGKKPEDKDIPYNYYIYHGPDWYLRVIPRLIHRAGFELGTGLSVNVIDPTMAAAEYREEMDKLQ